MKSVKPFSRDAMPRKIGLHFYIYRLLLCSNKVLFFFVNFLERYLVTPKVGLASLTPYTKTVPGDIPEAGVHQYDIRAFLRP